MRYKIVDNGSTPFVVETSGNQMKVWNTVLGQDDMPSKLIMDFEYKELFVGDKSRFAKTYGTTLLVRDKYSYILITSFIIRFWTFEIIREFHAPIVGLRVPYPYAIGDKNVYLNDYDKIFCVPKSEFDLTKDVFSQFYGTNGFTEPKVRTLLSFQICFSSGSYDREKKIYDLDKIPSITRKENKRRKTLKNKKKKTNQERYELNILEAKDELLRLRKKRPPNKKEYYVENANFLLQLAEERQKYFNLAPIPIPGIE